MRFFLGIDGGGTRTRAFAADVSASHVGRAEAGASNPHHARREEIRDRIASAAAEALRSAGASFSECVSIFLGIAGVTDDESRQLFRAIVVECGLGHAQIEVDHDIRSALAGGLLGREGIALIAGTGSSCYGRTCDGRSHQTGGWGSLIADEGSGYWIGCEAIAIAARMVDGRESATGLQPSVFAWLGIERITELLRRLYHPEISRREIASLAPLVLELAAAGDRAALSIAQRGAEALGAMVAANHRLLSGEKAASASADFMHSPEVTCLGGLIERNEFYRHMVESAIRRQLPRVRLQAPTLPAAQGATLLAMQQAGLDPDDEVIRRLSGAAIPTVQ